jgi:hypothetical protein
VIPVDDDGWVNVTVRMRPSEMAALDAIVAVRKGSGTKVSRASVVEAWVRRGIRESKRER